MRFASVNKVIPELKYNYIISNTGLLFKEVQKGSRSARVTLKDGSRWCINKLLTLSQDCCFVANRDTDYVLFFYGVAYHLKTYSTDLDGYYCYGFILKDGKKINPRVHQLVYKSFKGLVPKGHVIHHIDHNKTNNNLVNLKLMTQAEHVSYHDQFRSRDWHGRLV